MHTLVDIGSFCFGCNLKRNGRRCVNMNKPMDDLTNEQKIEFKLASNCSICGKKFEPDDEKVRDHCHFTGKYRGRSACKM